jgi:hypothetical protein
MRCGCGIGYKPTSNGMVEGPTIIFCPLHAAAEELLKMCKKAHNKINETAGRIQNLNTILSRELDGFLPSIESVISNAERTPDEPQR